MSGLTVENYSPRRPFFRKTLHLARFVEDKRLDKTIHVHAEGFMVGDGKDRDVERWNVGQEGFPAGQTAWMAYDRRTPQMVYTEAQTVLRGGGGIRVSHDSGGFGADRGGDDGEVRVGREVGEPFGLTVSVSDWIALWILGEQVCAEARS